jgi:hypothetical protein
MNPTNQSTFLRAIHTTVPTVSQSTVAQHYGHVARDSEESIRARLDARNAESGAKVASDGN